MRFISLTLSLTLILIVTGCTDYLINLSGNGPLLIPATQPTEPLTYKQQVDAMQRRLDDAWQIVRLGHIAGAVSDGQFKVAETYYGVVQAAVNAAYIAEQEHPETVGELLKRAADRLEEFKKDSAPGK